MSAGRSSGCNRMEVDIPGFLKRSNSAPMIHDINNTSKTTPLFASSRNRSSSSSSTCMNRNNFFVTEQRTRRFSASFAPRSGSFSSRAVARVDQLRQEECTDLLDREVAHENKLHSTMRISQSWEDLSLMFENVTKSDDNHDTMKQKGNNPFDPVGFQSWSFPSPTYSSSSPTRSNSTGFPRQCYSPSLFKHNLSPSPTRKSFATRRSLSPIAVRPSSLGCVKRKFDLVDADPPMNKRNSLGTVYVTTQSSRPERDASPLQSSISSVGTPESFSSVDSPTSFAFSAPDSPSDHTMQDVSKSGTELVQ